VSFVHATEIFNLGLNSSSSCRETN